MIKYHNIADALDSFEKSISKLERMTDVLNGTDSLPFAESIMGEFYNAIEALVWICNYDDSDPNGEQPFTPLKDIPTIRSNMPITPDIRRAAREICKGEKPNFKNRVSPKEYADFIDSVRSFVTWIKEHARNIKNDISEFAKHILHLTDKLFGGMKW